MKKVLSLLAGIVISIGMLVFSACDINYNGVEIVPSNSTIELAVGETFDFNVEIKNYFEQMSNQVQMNNPDNIISVIDKETTNNKTFFTIKALKVGTSTISFKSFEGNKECEITIIVYQPITSYSVKDNVYILKDINKTINFADEKYVDFAPLNARTENIKYLYSYLGEEIVVKGAKTINISGEDKFMLITQDDTQLEIVGDEFQLKTKIDNSDLPTLDFYVDILSPIKTGDLKIIKKGINSTYLATSEIVDEKITFITNNVENSYYEFELECDSAIVAKYEASGSDVLKTNVDNTYSNTLGNNVFFSMQARDVGTDKLKIKLYYANYPAYVEELSFDVLTTSVPTSLMVNNIKNYTEPITLYSNSLGGESVQPLSISVLSMSSEFEWVGVGFAKWPESNALPVLDNWQDYLEVYYKNSKITEDSFLLDYEDFKNNTISENLYIRGLQEYPMGTFYMYLNVHSEFLTETQTEMFIPITVKEGVKTLNLHSNYNKGLFLDIANGEQEFSGINYTSSTAKIGKMKISYENNSNELFSVRQKQENDVALIITPLNVGKGSFKITLGNGVSLTINVSVNQSVISANLDAINNANIAQKDMDADNNLKFLAIKYTENANILEQIKVALKLSFNPYKSNLYSIDAPSIDTIEQTDNVISYNSNDMIINILKTGNATLTISLSLLQVINFATQDTGNKITFVVEIISYSPIKELYFTQNIKSVNNTTEDVIVKEVSTFRQQDVGYKLAQDEGLSTTNFSLNAVLADGTKIDDVFGTYDNSTTKSITISSSQANSVSSNKIQNFGTYSRNKNQYSLVCNDILAPANTKFMIAFTIKEYNTTLTNMIYIQIKEYKPLYSIGFTNYVETLYLSSSNNSYTFNTILNKDADCQKYMVKFSPDNSANFNMFDINVDTENYSSTTITHRDGTGKGTLYFIPLCAILDEKDNFAYAQSIRVNFSNGEFEDNPMLISTAKEFIGAMENAPGGHYLITTSLDFTNITLKGDYTLSGTIKGASESARLLNLTVSGASSESLSNYAGLFKKISKNAKICNLVFEGKIDISLSNSQDNYIGLIAGENYGLIENCSVLLNSSNISVVDHTINTNKQVVIGGMFGYNEGLITTTIKSDNSSINHTFVKQLGTFNCFYNGHSSLAKVGGVVGDNKGIITRIIENPNLLYNENIYSASVNISAKGISYVGGIVGFNDIAENIVLQENTYPTNYIFGLLVNGNITSSRYSPVENVFIGGKNVGGIVGQTNSYIKNSTSRVFVKAYDYVGGIVGFDNTISDYSINNNNEFIVGNKVQAIKTSKFSSQIMGTSADGHVGSIAGNETIEINKNIYANNSNTAMYYYEADIANAKFPAVYNLVNGEYVNVKYDAEKEFLTLFRETTAKIEIDRILEDSDIIDAEKDVGTQKLLTQNTEYDNKVALMFYYEAKAKTEQIYINDLNLDRQIPFIFKNPDAVFLTSLSEEIIVINPNGKIDIKSTGLATIVVKNLLDETLSDYYLYIYVINAFDGFSIGFSAEEQLNDLMMVVYENAPKSFSYFYTHSNIMTVDNYYQNVEVKLNTCDIPTIEVFYLNSENNYVSFNDLQENEKFIYVNINGKNIIFTANALIGQTCTNVIKIKPNFNMELEEIGQVYIDNDGDDNNLNKVITETNKAGIFTLTAKKGTEKIDLSVAEITIEPIDEISVDITQTTDFNEDYVEIECFKTNLENSPTDYFVITSFEGYEYDAINKVYKKIQSEKSGNFKFMFNYEKYINTDYEGSYIIDFKADNGVNKSILVNMTTQSLNSLSVKNYYNIGQNYDATILQTDYVASGAYSLLVVEIYPYFADYDYILIKNAESNYEKNNIISFEVNKIINNNVFSFVYGITYDENGVKIPKSILKELAINSSTSKLYIKYLTTSKATVDSQATIDILAIKEQNNTKTIVFETQKTITVILKDNVSFAINNRKETTEKIYLAKGMTYDLTLNIFGFTEEQVVIEIKNKANSDSDAVSIQKIDGEYKLIVSNNILYTSGEEGLEVVVATYGRNIIDGWEYSSGKSYLNLVIVDFVVLTDNIYAFNENAKNINEYLGNTVIKNGRNAVISLNVGNSYKLENELVYGFTVEYDTSNPTIINSVKNFENSLKNSGNWSIKSSYQGIIGKYTTSLNINETTNFTTEYFKITGKAESGNKIISVVPLKIFDYENPMYYFNYSGKFVYQYGKPVFAPLTNISAFNLSTDFVFDVYPNSTEENAIPITTYAELLQMRANSHYILMNNIILPSDFTPLSTNIGSLDGNGYTITYPSYITFESGEKLGFFATVQAGTILKNIKIKIASLSSVIINSANAVSFGILAGENFGIITNCEVQSEPYVQLSVSKPNQASDITENYVAGLVAENNGYISNSRVQVNLTTVATLAGFVCVNENKIASSYVKNSSLINKGSADKHTTSGFVYKNGLSENSNAQIISSYVCGDVSSTNIYSTSQVYYINSNPMASGFVFLNYNTISDCYSDIYINASATRSGFVFNNAGKISNSYSTSSFNYKEDKDAFEFVNNNFIDENFGTIESSYYLRGNVNLMDNNTNVIGLTALDETDFSNGNNFKNFVISSSLDKTAGIWFYPSASNETAFTLGGVSQNFTYGKPNLVSANIITYSQKAQDSNNTTVNQTTGETIYAYYEKLTESGTEYNPILISSASSFENLIIQNAYNNVNSKTYRLIGDIEYSETSTISNLSSIIFVGNLEGNGMKISNFSINSTKSSINGGLFAQIGQGYSSKGVVKNLILAPKYLNFPNTQNAGTLAGLLEGGKIYNITCDGFENDLKGVAIFGVNCVGGVIGVATNNFEMCNITSSVSAKATYEHLLNSAKLGEFQTANGSNNVSYAGGVLGVANSGGLISNASVYDDTRSSAEIVGLLFGKIGKNVQVKNINQIIINSQFINVGVYGGIIAGESCGILNNINVSGEVKQDFFNIVDTQKMTTAIGGLVGLQTGGAISNFKANFDLSWSEISPSVVGGIVGEMLGGTIGGEKILNSFNGTFDGNITILGNKSKGAISKISVGGIVGELLSSQSMEMTTNIVSSNVKIINVETSGNISVETVNILKICTGGIIGKTVNSYKILDSQTTDLFKYELNNVISDFTNIDVQATIYNGTLQLYIGGLIGASFADSTENYAGEMLIRDNLTENQLINNLQCKSNSKLSINILDLKGNGTANLYFGGIMGYGYSVSDYTKIDGIPSRFESWGLMLKNGSKLLTEPIYNGRYYVEDDTQYEYITMENSEYLNIKATCQIEKYENN